MGGFLLFLRRNRLVIAYLQIPPTEKNGWGVVGLVGLDQACIEKMVGMADGFA
jgi:hypothetical protein